MRGSQVEGGLLLRAIGRGGDEVMQWRRHCGFNRVPKVGGGLRVAVGMLEGKGMLPRRTGQTANIANGIKRREWMGHGRMVCEGGEG